MGVVNNRNEIREFLTSRREMYTDWLALSTRSEEFRVRWAVHNVRFHRAGVKQMHHPHAGDLTCRGRSTRRQ